MDDFGWRISLADVAADGPFSAFPGVDRVLTVIDGAGLVLDVEGQATTLDAAAPPLAFAGEAKVAARLTAGPIRDLNLMVRRGLWRARARWMTVAGAARVTTQAAVTLVLALDALRITGPEGVVDLAPLDAALLDTQGYRLSLEGHGRTLIAEIEIDPPHRPK
jgi:environmental stress-induced protein Ves